VEEQRNIGEFVERLPVIIDVSSLNLRSGRRGCKKTCERICVHCSVCGGRFFMGKGTDAMAKVKYSFMDKEVEVVICGVCLDVFVDLLHVGQRLVDDKKWRVRSKTARVSMVEDVLLCGNCWRKADTHMFIKFDNLLIGGKSEAYGTKRVCARCVVSYLELMVKSGFMKRRIFSYVEEKDVKEVQYCRGMVVSA
jgi:hypothetical protein